MRSILFIDDKKDPKDFLGTRGQYVVIARTLLIGLAFVRQGLDPEHPWPSGRYVPWDEIWLDHDLGMAAGKPTDIIPLLHYMEEHQPPCKLIVSITDNPVGEKHIQDALYRHYRIGKAERI